VIVLLAAMCVAGGIAVACYGVGEWYRLRRESLERLLEAELAEPSATPDALADLMERAGALADKALSGTSMIHKIQVMLGEAGWSLRPGEFAATMAAATFAFGGAMWMLGGLPAALIACFTVPLGSIAWLGAKGRRRTRKIEDELPSVLQLLAGSLESGSSVLHSLELAASEGQEPLASEFGRVVAETRVGRPLVESLEAMATRIGSRDVEWTVEAIRIQHTTGGKLADTLRVLADFMRSRVEVRGEVRALSAEARLSAKVLTALPFLVGGYFLAFRRDYLNPLFNTSGGRWMLIIAGVGIALGSMWMRRIVRIEV
jgi:tight adherence protein B